MTLPHVDDSPPVTSASAMTRRWRELLGDGGLGKRELWVAMLGPDRRQLLPLPIVEDVPEHPDPVACAQLVHQLGQALLEAGGRGGHLALALARPGGRPAEASDEAWAAELRTAAGKVGVPLLSVHLAVGEHVLLLR